MKWFQVKEKSAGKKRLILTYHIYKIFGMKAVRVIAFMMGLISFLLNKDLSNYSDWCYIYTLVKEDNMEEIKRLNNIKSEANNTIISL